MPDLYVTVKPHNDQTWNAAVDRAKAYELTHQDQNAVTAYLNKFAPSGTTTQSDDLLKAIQDLTKQVQTMGTGSRNNRSYNNGGYRNNNPSTINQQSRIVCYSCGQPGHIVRNCPNGNNNNRPAPVNNNNNGNVSSGNNTNTPQSTSNDGQQLSQIQQLLAQLLPQGQTNDQSLN